MAPEVIKGGNKGHNFVSENGFTMTDKSLESRWYGLVWWYVYVTTTSMLPGGGLVVTGGTDLWTADWSLAIYYRWRKEFTLWDFQVSMTAIYFNWMQITNINGIRSPVAVLRLTSSVVCLQAYLEVQSANGVDLL